MSRDFHIWSQIEARDLKGQILPPYRLLQYHESKVPHNTEIILFLSAHRFINAYGFDTDLKEYHSPNHIAPFNPFVAETDWLFTSSFRNQFLRHFAFSLTEVSSKFRR